MLEKEYKVCEYQNRKGKSQYHLFWRYKILPLWFTVKGYDGYSCFDSIYSSYDAAVTEVVRRTNQDEEKLDSKYKRVKCTTIKGIK